MPTKTAPKKSSLKKTVTSTKVRSTTVATQASTAKRAAAPVKTVSKRTAPKSDAAIKKPSTKTLVERYRTHKADTGSTSVQVAMLSEQIDELSRHLKTHPKDFDSRRGLLIMVGKRRRLLNYLGRSDQPQYQKLIGELKLRK